MAFAMVLIHVISGILFLKWQKKAFTIMSNTYTFKILLSKIKHLTRAFTIIYTAHCLTELVFKPIRYI